MWCASNPEPLVSDAVRPADNDLLAVSLQTFDRLRPRGFWSDKNPAELRFAALMLGATGQTIYEGRLEEVAKVLSQEEGFMSPLATGLEIAVAAMIIRHRLDPRAIRTRIQSTRDEFESRGIHVGRIAPTALTLAALVLAIHSKGRPVAERQFIRLREIYEAWKADHRLMPRSCRLPLAALHATSGKRADHLTAHVRHTYRILARAGFLRVPMLRYAAYLLAVSPEDPEFLAYRYQAVAKSLKRGCLRATPARYDEIALLALSRRSPDRVASRALEFLDRMRGTKPRPPKELAFTLAAGLALTEDCPHGQEREAADLVALLSLYEIKLGEWFTGLGVLYDFSWLFRR